MSVFLCDKCNFNFCISLKSSPNGWKIKHEINSNHLKNNDETSLNNWKINDEIIPNGWGKK